MIKKIFRKGVCAAVALTLALSVFVPASFASAPKLKDVEYKGNGRVEVEFRGDVRYKNYKITVRDNNGNKYGTRVVERDSDELEFVVKNYKVGKTYTVKVSGVRKVGTTKYGTVVGQFTIKKTIGKAKAKNIALNNFYNKYNGSKSKIDEVDVDYKSKSNRYVVSIETVREVEYDYYISATSGKIVKVVIDRD